MPGGRVKEAYVKMHLFRPYHERYLAPMYGRESMNNDEYDWLLNVLRMAPVVLSSVLRAGANDGIFSRSMVREITEADDVVAALFDALTRDDIPEAKRVDVARSKIKSALHGCGMPRQKLARGVVESYRAEVEAEQEAGA